MRLTSSSSSALVVALLAKDVLAAVHGGHQNFHRRRAELDVTVTDEIVETITQTQYVTIDWPSMETIGGQALSAAAVATTAPGTTTTVQVASVTPSSSTTTSAADTVKVAAAAVSSPAAAAAPSIAPVDVVDAAHLVQNIKSSVAVVIPTTLATLIKPTTAAPAAPSTPAVSNPGSGSSSGKKRGLSYNIASLTAPFIGGNSQVTWAYNWGSSSDGLPSGLEYVPTLWGLGSDKVNPWKANAEAAIAAGSTHLFSFNEPDLGEQANIPDVNVAAQGFMDHMQPFAGKAKLGAPAVTNGGGSMGLTYLSKFVAACSSCTLDFVNIHWYDSATNYAYFKNHVMDAYKAGGGRPVWITEFAASGSDAEQQKFLEVVIPWLDAQPFVERYAYFMCKDGVLVSGSGVTDLGNTFMSFTSSLISSLIS